MTEEQNALPTTEIKPSRASLVFITLTVAASLLSWPIVIGLAFSTRSETGDTQILALAAFATTLSLGGLVFAMRYLVRDAARRDHLALLKERQAARAVLMAELRHMGDKVTARLDDTTRELDTKLLAQVAQNAMAHAHLAAMSEQISVKLDNMYWGVVADSAHIRGHAKDGECVVLDFESARGEKAQMRLRSRDGA